MVSQRHFVPFGENDTMTPSFQFLLAELSVENLAAFERRRTWMKLCSGTPSKGSCGLRESSPIRALVKDPDFIGLSRTGLIFFPPSVPPSQNRKKTIPW